MGKISFRASSNPDLGGVPSFFIRGQKEDAARTAIELISPLLWSGDDPIDPIDLSTIDPDELRAALEVGLALATMELHPRRLPARDAVPNSTLVEHLVKASPRASKNQVMEAAIESLKALGIEFTRIALLKRIPTLPGKWHEE